MKKEQRPIVNKNKFKCEQLVTAGETIENKVWRIVQNKEAIADSAPMIYTHKRDGVDAQYDIRTDKWDIALNAISALSIRDRAKYLTKSIKDTNENGNTSNEGTASQTVQSSTNTEAVQ